MMDVYLGYGSNMGDRAYYLGAAVSKLKRCGDIQTVSPWYETEPVGGPTQNWFLNGALHIQTILSPLDLLLKIQNIEHEFGRERIIHHGPRTIDVDILLYGDEIVRMRELIIPHQGMHLRRFVLKPLVDIAPDRMHPVFQQTLSMLLLTLEDAHVVKPYDPTHS